MIFYIRKGNFYGDVVFTIDGIYIYKGKGTSGIVAYTMSEQVVDRDTYGGLVDNYGNRAYIRIYEGKGTYGNPAFIIDGSSIYKSRYDSYPAFIIDGSFIYKSRYDNYPAFTIDGI